MSVSRDDFSIAFRSALLQRGASQKFSVLSLIFLAFVIFFLDVYGAKFTAKMSSASSNLTLATGEAAGVKAELDLTDGIVNVGGKTYGLIVKLNDSNKATTARAMTPSAMIKLSDDTFDAITSSPEESDAHTATVQHLADLGNVHMTTNSDYWTTSDKGMVFKSSNTVTTTEIASGTHKIRVKVNGSDMFLLAVANGHSTF